MLRKLITIVSKPYVECAEKKNTHNQIGDEAFDDDDRKGTLRI
jgi:hypothetical protein